MREKQLKRTIQLTKSRWAVWLWRSLDTWRLGMHSGLNTTRREALLRMLERSTWRRWLAGGVSNGRPRRRKVSEGMLGCQRVYLFPAQNGALLVGADDLGETERRFWQVLSWDPPSEETLVSQEETGEDARPFVLRTATSYDLDAVLEQVLIFMSTLVHAQGAFIALRSGRYLEIRATWHLPEAWREHQIAIPRVPLVQDVLSRRQVECWEGTLPAPMYPSDAPPPDFAAQAAWMGVPIVLGRRVIALAIFLAAEGRTFDERAVQRIQTQAVQVAHLVENAIVFHEAGRYLAQLTLVNDLSTSTVGEIRLEKVTRRVLRRLERAFEYTLAALLFPGDGYVQAHTARRGVWDEPLDTSTLPEDLWKIERLRRVADPPEGCSFPWFSHPVYAQLFIPLQYRGNTTAILHLGRTRPHSFSRQDEQGLLMLSGHLAALLENVRLHAETRQRAENLTLIHTVVQRVVGLTSVDEIAQAATELMVSNFAFDRASLLLTSPRQDVFTVLGLSGLDVSPGLRGARFPVECGLFPGILLHGRSIRVTHLDEHTACQALNPLPQAAAMGVPLYDGERIFGALYVERVAQAFSENDLIALQALAGVLSSVLVNAQRYQQLQTSVRQLQAVRETSLDMAGEMDLEVLLRRVVHRVRLLVEARGAELALVQADSVRIVVSENPWQDYTGKEIPMMAGIIGRVAALGHPLVVNDYNSWEGREHPDSNEPFQAVAAVPLQLQGQVIGVLVVSDDQPERVFRTDDVRLLELLAPQVAVFIRNARLYQELQERMAAQKATEQQLVRSARLAAVGEMAAGVAHELNNPLTTVTGFVELVLEELPESLPQRADLELVLREARRARSVVRNLLDFSRPTENMRIRTDINELIGEVLTLVQHLVRTLGVELRIQLWDEVPLVSVDPNQIKQVLLNLVHNALQAMPHGGVLTLQTTQKRRKKQRWLLVRVEDTGVGISPENLSRIFEPFFTTRPVGSGTGLGLSVSYGIVKEHGGFIEVESTPGEGSCFTIWLPIENHA